MTPSAHPLGEAWERVRSPATPWLGGRNIHDRFSRDWKPAGAAPGAQTPARPLARSPARPGISSHRPQRWPAGPEPGGGGSSLSTPPRLAPYRALGTSTGPRPPPGPARASPPYFSSMPAQEPPLPAPRALLMSRRRDGSAGAGASLPHASGAPRPRKPSRPRRSPGARQAGTRALGGTRPRAVPVAPVSGGRTGRDAAGPRHPAQQPSLPRE